MKELKDQLFSSGKELNHVSTVAIVGMLIALSCILSSCRIIISNVFQISFAFLPLAVCCMMFGPAVGAIMGAVSDILGCVVNPAAGVYFPGFTLNAILMGLLFGFSFYRKYHKVTLKRTIVVSAISTVVFGFFLIPLWLYMMYGNASTLFSGARMISNLILFPINAAMLFSILKIVERVSIQQSS